MVREKIIKEFGGRNMNMKIDDFMSFIADIFSGGVQGGKRTEMCNFLTDPKYKNKEV